MVNISFHCILQSLPFAPYNQEPSCMVLYLMYMLMSGPSCHSARLCWLVLSAWELHSPESPSHHHASSCNLSISVTRILTAPARNHNIYSSVYVASSLRCFVILSLHLRAFFRFCLSCVWLFLCPLTSILLSPCLVVFLYLSGPSPNTVHSLLVYSPRAWILSTGFSLLHGPYKKWVINM